MSPILPVEDLEHRRRSAWRWSMEQDAEVVSDHLYADAALADDLSMSLGDFLEAEHGSFREWVVETGG